MEGAAEQGERARNLEAHAIEARRPKSGACAAKEGMLASPVCVSLPSHPNLSINENKLAIIYL